MDRLQYSQLLIREIYENYLTGDCIHFKRFNFESEVGLTRMNAFSSILIQQNTNLPHYYDVYKTQGWHVSASNQSEIIQITVIRFLEEADHGKLVSKYLSKLFEIKTETTRLVYSLLSNSMRRLCPLPQKLIREELQALCIRFTTRMEEISMNFLNSLPIKKKAITTTPSFLSKQCSAVTQEFEEMQHHSLVQVQVCK